MATINATTKIGVPVPVPKKKAALKNGNGIMGLGGKKKAAPKKRGSAPPLQPVTLKDAASKAELKNDTTEVQQQRVHDLFRQALGERPTNSNIATPHTASTTKARGAAAADLAVACTVLGVRYVLHDCHIMADVQRILIPDGIQEFLSRGGDADSVAGMSDDGAVTHNNTLKPSASAVSLSSLLDDMTHTTITSAAGAGGGISTANNSIVSDTKRGKTTPANAREGCLLLLRALCEIVGRPGAEPYVVGAFLAAALDECGSSSGAIREAADDASTAIVQLANPWVFVPVVEPLLRHALQMSTEWRIKAAALDRLALVANNGDDTAKQINKLIPQLLPIVGEQVWDTKAQVSKSARGALLAICGTNRNRDIKPAIPAIVNAICKPADTNKAVSELMGTTFVVPVDASTLAILCPILARALKEKLAIHKRAACLVISNMAKLVESPDAVAPFGSLLVPELHRVSENVQFTEIRDEALKALRTLTKALGDAYSLEKDNQEHVKEMAAEKAKVEAEQERLRQEQLAQKLKDDEMARKEVEERKKFKEAMEAQRQLEKLEAEEAARQKQEEDRKKEAAKLSTKGGTGKCQSCGLKKCKKSCMFFDGK